METVYIQVNFLSEFIMRVVCVICHGICTADDMSVVHNIHEHNIAILPEWENGIEMKSYPNLSTSNVK